jgi:4-amino-4-deoxy-L-arabinose transferase-like glycosyltransferase
MLWYDALLTYYGATAPTFDKFIAGITHFDFNPPLLYGLVRIILWLFGDSAYAVRLPSVLDVTPRSRPNRSTI